MHLNLWSPFDPNDEHHMPLDESSVLGVDADVATIYRAEAPRLARYFRHRVPRMDDIPDLVQRAFIRFLGIGTARRASLDSSEAYLRRIGLNLVRDDAKSATTRAERTHISMEDVPLPSADPHAQLEARDMLARVDAAMLALPERTREIFMAHRFDDMSYREIAMRSGLSVKTIEKHMSRALTELHRLLADAA